MRLRPALALAAALWAAGALAAHAEEGGESGGPRIYRWIDENGIAHYTTDPARIPAPLRERVGNPEALSQKPLEARAPDSWADLDAEASAEDAEADGAEDGELGLLSESNAAANGGESSAAADGGEGSGAQADSGAAGGSSETRGGGSELRGSGSQLNGGALQSGRRGSGRGLRMRAAAVQRMRGAESAARFAGLAANTPAGNATATHSASTTIARGSSNLAADATGGLRLAGAGAESALRERRGRLAELNARIAELEARIAAEEEVIKNHISTPDTETAAAGDAAADATGGDEALLARAARLPGWMAELRALREERAALSGGG